MTNFLLLYGGGERSRSRGDMAAAMTAWEAWLTELGEAVVDRGNPFRQAKSIASDGSVSDGPLGVMPTGYLIIQAESLDEAVEMAKACPLHLGGLYLTVYETFQVT